jgi:hypothetical protein
MGLILLACFLAVTGRTRQRSAQFGCPIGQRMRSGVLGHDLIGVTVERRARRPARYDEGNLRPDLLGNVAGQRMIEHRHARPPWSRTGVRSPLVHPRPDARCRGLTRSWMADLMSHRPLQTGATGLSCRGLRRAHQPACPAHGESFCTVCPGPDGVVRCGSSARPIGVRTARTDRCEDRQARRRLADGR